MSSKEAVFPPNVLWYCKEGYVFVPRKSKAFLNGEEFDYVGISEILADKAQDEEIVRCVICGEPAIKVDRHFPKSKLDNRCEKHLHSLVDELVYEEYGEAVVVCREHHQVCLLRDNINKLLDKLRENKEGRELDEALCEAQRKLVSYMAKKWPDEQFGPRKP